MRLETEAELIQNSALGAALLWAFTAEFVGAAQQSRGPTLPLALLVLPMALHQETMLSLHSRNYDGGLDLALAENRTLTVDLQERMRAMEPQTMVALNVAFGSGLLTYEREQGELRIARKTNPFDTDSVEVRRMLNTARRLGYWFCVINPQRLGALLRIRF